MEHNIEELRKKWNKSSLEEQLKVSREFLEAMNPGVNDFSIFPPVDQLTKEEEDFIREGILEAINEEKVEPKFKVGEWVVGSNNVFKIISLNDELNCYIAVTTNNEEVKIPYYFDDGQGHMCSYHQWSIQDANDGDVLAAHECYVIFKEIDGLNIKCYCTYHYLGYNPIFYVNTLQNKDAFHPAIKEQCDFLFQKMKEVGYEWDVNKKELRKDELNDKKRTN